MAALVLGSSGYVGRHLMNVDTSLVGGCRSVSEDQQSIFVDVSKFTVETLKSIFDVFEVIIALPWYVSHHDYKFSDENFIWKNIYIEKIIPAFIQSRAGYILSTGTCLEYGNTSVGPLNINSALEPRCKYGQAKVDTYQELRKEVLDAGKKYCWVRPFFVFGNDNNDNKLFPSIQSTLEKGDNFVFKEPENVNDYIHVKKLVKDIHFLASKKIEGTFNLGSGYPIRNIDLLDILRGISDPQKRLAAQYYSQDIGLFCSDAFNPTSDWIIE